VKIIGIGSWNTNQLRAVMEGGAPKVIHSAEGRNVIPSVVDPIKNIVGDVAKRQMVINPKSTVYSVKRLMGGSIRFISAKRHQAFTLQRSNQAKMAWQDVEVEGKVLLLRNICKSTWEIKADAEKYLENQSQGGYYGPAYFDDCIAQATKHSRRNCGTRSRPYY